MPSPFPCSPVIRECSWKKTQIEKKKHNWILLILRQMLVKSFCSNIIIHLSYNLKKYIRYEHVWKLFQVGCVHQHTVIAVYRLDRNEKLPEILRILVTTVHFRDRNWISRTVYFQAAKPLRCAHILSCKTEKIIWSTNFQLDK